METEKEELRKSILSSKLLDCICLLITGRESLGDKLREDEREREGERERVGGPEINPLILPHRRIVDKPSPRAYYS